MKFVAFERAKQGTGASRRLRNTGMTPGIVFGGNAQPVTIELDHNALWHTINKEVFHTSVLEMDLAGNTEKVVLRSVQYHPFKPQVLHVDFQRVDETTRLTKKVPLRFINAEQSPAVKADKCIVNHAMTTLEVNCVALSMPEHIDVDLANMTKGTSLHISDLVLPTDVKVVTHGRGNLAVVSMVEPKEEVVAAPVAVVADKGKKKGKK